MANGVSVNEPMVRFANVQKSYDGETLVVKDLNLEIARRRVSDDAGPVGVRQDHDCLMMLAGFEPATHGEIYLEEQSDQRGAAAQARHRHGVPELRAVPAHDGGNENLAYPLKVREHAARPKSRPGSSKALEDGRDAAVRLAPARHSCRAASSSGSRWRGRWSSSRTSSSWTSRWAPSTSSCASRCSMKSSTSRRGSASPSSMSRTTRPRR
jgi:ABC-type Fe3+/spermidine/putrescine transport system ATPase subunit